MRFTVEGGRYQARPGAEGQQFYCLEGGPRAGDSGGLPGVIPNRLTGYPGGHYAATGERNHKHQHVYRWRPDVDR